MDNIILNAQDFIEAALVNAKALGISYALALETERASALGDRTIDLGVISKVTYNEKSDRYVVHFAHGSARVTTEVATFLLQHAFGAKASAQVFAYMGGGGSIENVALVFYNR